MKMKARITKQIMRNGFLGLALSLFGFAANAQHTASDITKQANIQYGTTTTGGAVKVIDNKGTVKYLQVQNGITMLTNTTGDKTTTTWQLGGQLTDDTYIDVNGKAFALDGIDMVDPATLLPSTDATDKSLHGTGTGYTMLVRDEVTGAIKKLKATQLVISGHQIFAATAGATAQVFAVTTPDNVLPDFSKVSVYRNGAKLVASVDYTISASSITVTPTAYTVAGADNEWEFNAADVVEVHWFK